MLPTAARVHTRHDHRLVSQTGCRVRRGALVVALAVPPATPQSAGGQPRGAVIAGRRVGPAVVRNRVKRRLRELVRARMPELPAGSLLVVRALPGAAAASYGQLGGWIDLGLRSCAAQLPAGGGGE